MRFKEKIADYRESDQRRNITGDFYAKGVGQHNRPRKKIEYIAPFFKNRYFFILPDVADGELSTT